MTEVGNTSVLRINKSLINEKEVLYNKKISTQSLSSKCTAECLDPVLEPLVELGPK